MLRHGSHRFADAAGGGLAFRGQGYCSGFATAGYYFLKLGLSLGNSFGKPLSLTPVRRLYFSGPDFFFLLDARAFALDAGEVGIGLRDLISEGGGFAEEAQNYGARGFNGALGFADTELEL